MFIGRLFFIQIYFFIPKRNGSRTNRIHENFENYRGMDPNDHSTDDLSIKLANDHLFVSRQHFPKILSLEYSYNFKAVSWKEKNNRACHTVMQSPSYLEH